jgi:hypothetical protein
MRNVSDIICRENQNTHFISNHIISLFENRAVYEIMWKNSAQPGRPQITIWCIRVAWRIPKATQLSEYVIPIAFPQQQWLHERTSMLRYTYIACLVVNSYCIFRKETGPCPYELRFAAQSVAPYNFLFFFFFWYPVEMGRVTACSCSTEPISTRCPKS